MATYNYEHSDPERFQHFCQALLLADYPDLQCLPVGQADGGRDGIAFTSDPPGQTVLQVKFKRRDDPIRDDADWVIKGLVKELPKVKRLAEHGTTKYILATNARGTGSLESGGIDRVQRWLDSNLPIPAQCLWRDDLDRRLEGSLAVQWRYPELLTGSEGIRLAMESFLQEDRDRRSKGLKRFVVSQFDKDAEVKFKQVDLTNDLLSLFIDVPADFSERIRPRLSKQQRTAYHSILRRYAHAFPEALFHVDWDMSSSPIEISEEFRSAARSIGTASLLLDFDFQAHFPQVVLEGAPGQGKSTLAQYVCQVHRARFLAKRPVIDSLPDEQQNAPVRLPIKIDLRDFATWLRQRDPFLADHPEATDSWQPSLEAFIARLINFESGGIEFTPYDVSTSLAQVPSLLFLDGLDEVAEIDTRRTLVDAVRLSLQRFQADEVDLQVVVTSRPAAFANTPGFSSREFSYLELVNINRQQILDYSEKWIEARKLSDADGNEVRQVLSTKMRLPHIRDLARNPMQLTILLTLIHSMGYSLPDERTQLYSSYMEKFLTREAEKSPAVREYRSLLVKIHQHLAWVLQTAAESERRSSGSVTADELRVIIRDYLHQHGHSESVLEVLFTGMLERVYVLVQRVEGAYEFEVQPIREFFCAKHLYETAASYDAGSDQPGGTKNERFRAIARNPYWTNVTRFYAGFYTGGELGGLYFELEHLLEDSDLLRSFRPRQLGVMLLSDWVFKESPRITRRALDGIFDDLGTKGATSNFARLNVPRSPISLPRDCGSAELSERVLTRLDSDGARASSVELARLLASNGGESLQSDLRSRITSSTGRERTRWIEIACTARALDDLDEDFHTGLVLSDHASQEEIRRRNRCILVHAPGEAQQIPAIVDSVVEWALEGDGPFALGDLESWLLRFSTLANGTFAGFRLREHLYSLKLHSTEVVKDVPARWHGIAVFLREVEDLDRISNRQWETSLHPWDTLVGSLTSNLGSYWCCYGLAAQAAGIRSREERGQGASRLFDRDASLCRRARFARLRRGSPKWWLEQRDQAVGPLDEMFWVLLVFMWGPSPLGPELRSSLDRAIAGFDRRQYVQLFHSTQNAQAVVARVNKPTENEYEASPRLNALLGVVGRVASPKDTFGVLQDAEDDVIRRYATRYVLDSKFSDTVKDGSGISLSDVRQYYRDFGILAPALRQTESRKFLTKETARDVLREPLLYPYELVAWSEELLNRSTSSFSIAAVAAREGWTFE